MAYIIVPSRRLQQPLHLSEPNFLFSGYHTLWTATDGEIIRKNTPTLIGSASYSTSYYGRSLKSVGLGNFSLNGLNLTNSYPCNAAYTIVGVFAGISSVDSYGNPNILRWDSGNYGFGIYYTRSLINLNQSNNYFSTQLITFNKPTVVILRRNGSSGYQFLCSEWYESWVTTGGDYGYSGIPTSIGGSAGYGSSSADIQLVSLFNRLLSVEECLEIIKYPFCMLRKKESKLYFDYYTATSSGNKPIAVNNGEQEVALNIPLTNLGTGTPTATTLLRGDGVWVEPTATIDIDSKLELSNLGGF